MILKDEKGNVVNTFDSQVECAKYLGLFPSSVAKRISKNELFSFNNQLVYLEVENL